MNNFPFQRDLRVSLCYSIDPCIDIQSCTLIFSAILDDNFTSRMSLQNIQKDLRLAIDMGDMYDQPLHVAAASNEVYMFVKCKIEL